MIRRFSPAVVAFALLLGASGLAPADTGAVQNVDTGAVQNQDDQMGRLMQNIDAVCSDPDSSACAAALSQIEPCGKGVAPASRQFLASAGLGQTGFGQTGGDCAGNTEP